MRLQTAALTLIAAIGLAACGGSATSRSATSSAPAKLPPGALTSAAAKYCTGKGGRIKAETGRSGRAEAICYLPDHRIVEINSLYDVEVVNRL